MAVSVFTSPRTGGSGADLKFSITGEKAPSTLSFLSVFDATGEDQEPQKIPPGALVGDSWKGNASPSGGHGGYSRNRIRIWGLPFNPAAGGVRLRGKKMRLGVAQRGEEPGRCLAHPE